MEGVRGIEGGGGGGETGAPPATLPCLSYHSWAKFLHTALVHEFRPSL